MKTLCTVRGTPVFLLNDGGVQFTGGMTIDADGSPRAYVPTGSGKRGLDHLANAGHPGNWWGVVTDAAGTPYVQGPNDPQPGFYVSATSYERRGFARRDPRRYLDSEAVAFIVVPGFMRRLLKPVVLGCAALVTDTRTGRERKAIVGDFGPATHLGEASMRVAMDLGVNADPRTGGVDAPRFLYSFWPGHELTLDGERFELLPA